MLDWVLQVFVTRARARVCVCVCVCMCVCVCVVGGPRKLLESLPLQNPLFKDAQGVSNTRVPNPGHAFWATE